MGALIAGYLLIALIVGALFFTVVTHAAMLGVPPFGWRDPVAEASAAELNASCNELIALAGLHLGSAVLLLCILATAVYIGLSWPVTVFKRLSKWVRK